MKNKALKSLLCCLAVLSLIFGILPVSADTAAKAQSFVNGIIRYKLEQSGAGKIQDWINGELTKNAGATSEWYIIALSQSGEYDFSSYEAALVKYLSENEVYSASSRQKYALALAACGSNEKYIYTTLNDSIGQQGIMSWVYGLHLLNNGYKPKNFTVKTVKQQILSMQKNDGGWAIMGSSGDTDVTAMTLQALAVYYKSDNAVKKAVDKALSFLSSKQESGGGYKSYNKLNPESAAQVLGALSALGVDPLTDSRFIKNGNTLFDAMDAHRLADGTFCHNIGESYSESATVQVYYSSVAYLRMQKGKSGFYILDNADPAALQVPSDSKPASNSSQNSSDTASNPPTASENLSAGTATESDAESQKENSQNATTSSNSSSAADFSSLTDSSVSSTKGENIEKADNNTESGKAEGGEADAKENEGISEKVPENENISSGNSHQSAEKGNEKNKKISYKLWVSLGIVLIAGIVCVVLFCLKKGNIKDFIFIAVLALSGVLFVLFTNFSSVEKHYSSGDKNAVGTVTVTIRCDTVKGEADHIPENGIILDTVTAPIGEGDTVYDILKAVTAENKIHMEASGSGESQYVEGMANIYEFDFGDFSGWIYFVNGKEASVSCGEYSLSDGDKIEWHYTRKLGQDIKN